jgi:hypothetical protein
MMRLCTRRNGSNPLGSLSLHPRCGDPGGCESADHPKIARTAEGGACSKSPVWFRLVRLRARVPQIVTQNTSGSCRLLVAGLGQMGRVKSAPPVFVFVFFQPRDAARRRADLPAAGDIQALLFSSRRNRAARTIDYFNSQSWPADWPLHVLMISCRPPPISPWLSRHFPLATLTISELVPLP